MFESISSSSPATPPATPPVAPPVTPPTPVMPKSASPKPAKKFPWPILAIVLILGILGWGINWYLTTKKTPEDVNQLSGNSTSTDVNGISILPTSSQSGLENSGNSSSTSAVEYLSFFNFYKAPSTDFKFSPPQPNFPVNIKTDAANYYDFSRKINIDSVLGDLNKYGLAIIDNPLGTVNKKNKGADNFYSAYDLLNQKPVPLLITSDFLVYYYQNTLKSVFKDIEANVFYSSLSSITKKLFENSRDRYQASLTKYGNINDPVLEAQRLEVAYLATAMELLKPTSDQIINKGQDDTRFSASEAKSLDFTMPSYLKDDVLKEVELIRGHGKPTKSPVFLYTRNYADFVVPDDYKRQAKLNNFYLTTRWLNSNFPLYYKSADCPACELSYEDWRIRTIAAAYLASDLFNDDAIKNDWARIYKVLGYFRGLRDDLSFVEYRDVLKELFGQNYKIEEVLAVGDSKLTDALNKFQTRLFKSNYIDLYGAYNSNNLSLRPLLGAKMLADSYFPNQYLYQELTSPAVGPYLGKSLGASNNTACSTATSKNIRCVANNSDIVNLVYSLNNPYFKENSNYQNYEFKSSLLKGRLATLGDYWHNHNYFSDLFVIKKALANQQLLKAMESPAYQAQNLNRSLATLANLELPMDKIVLYQKYESGPGLGQDSSGTAGDSYVDPNMPLINELLANAEMVSSMLSALKLDSGTTGSSLKLRDLVLNLRTIKSIATKEISGETLSSDDYQFIPKLVKEYKIESPGAKTMQIKGINNRNLTVDLSNVKIMIWLQQKGKNLVLTAGPVFSYWEKK